ncbi:5-(carboxyamino)imidazole ribonucleotide mutase [Caldivirga sp. MU80]|uniref:5-(carboxyamino)imidazole ribonucleotide mutase n=1 Tax=Caldivirga sp. MU80 TaxID=1650354 RepID=UPI000837502E|nr:5-(carboxyamino)imidazole ribonucleotide mutase [Caldivirga sp. MU80]
MSQVKPLVGVIMGSKSDWDVMKETVDELRRLNIPYEVRVVSAHRTPELMFEYARTAADRGLEVIIAGAGGAAHLPGMTSSLTPLPVVGIPIMSRQLNGIDSLLSIVQMPYGIPVATVAINGARNAALLAARILGIKYPEFRQRVIEFMNTMRDEVLRTVLGDA